ncbi:AEC family transporter [Mycoplana sp. MJR14]|uniref:AEC family transporter n=1 Tax=Mycoplana sp. MJR14 TaxID=3032583 RepID=UPI0011DF7667|nr:AEC family transporter [Mycoplana sp. MJR14]MDF1634833.1 AEC family transporter [Mycoplana sp. MJR14]
MLVVFESILPVFLLVILGTVLKRWRKIDDGLWVGLEQLGFYVLFPALLFSTLAQADFAGMEAGTLAIASIGSVTLMSAAILLAWPLFRKAGVSAASFTTVFQTSTRWNGFMALATAGKLYGQEGIGMLALIMTLIIIPINLYNIGILVWFGGGARDVRVFLTKVLTNPLVLASALGAVFNLLGISLYAPVMETIDLVAEASLSLGLIMVGAGLRVADALRPTGVALLSVALKLFAMPLVMVSAAWLLGIEGNALLVVALGASVPTAMNGYLLAKQMGGDAPLYASVATLQTAASFLTIPLVLTLAAYAAG